MSRTGEVMGESSAKQQDDPVFVAFRRKLADVVTVAINSGKTVRSLGNIHHCPLGCHPNSSEPRGLPYAAFGISRDDAWRFVAAFDGWGSALDAGDPYYDLGRLYRARFP